MGGYAETINFVDFFPLFVFICSLFSFQETIDDWRLVPLNLFICLIAKYFDQSDLKDEVSWQKF